MRGALERRGEALAAAERARDDAARRVAALADDAPGERRTAPKEKKKKKRIDETAGGTAAWAAANAGSFSETLFSAYDADASAEDSSDASEKNLRATQAEVEERLRAARATWEARERDLRRRVRQLESAAEAFDFASGADKEGKTSRESLRILANKPRRRFGSGRRSSRRPAAAKQARRDKAERLRWSARFPRRAARRRRRRTPRAGEEREAEAAVWAQLETTLREQIAAYERKKKRGSLEDPNEPNDRDGSTNESTSGDDDRGRMRGEPLVANGERRAASLRAEVERPPPQAPVGRARRRRGGDQARRRRNLSRTRVSTPGSNPDPNPGPRPRPRTRPRTRTQLPSRVAGGRGGARDVRRAE